MWKGGTDEGDAESEREGGRLDRGTKEPLHTRPFKTRASLDWEQKVKKKIVKGKVKKGEKVNQKVKVIARTGKESGDRPVMKEKQLE